MAVVRDRRGWADLGAKLLPLLDRVYAAVRAGKLVQTGQNIFIFRDGSKDEVTVEVGVEAAAAFEPADGVFAAATPASGAIVKAGRRTVSTWTPPVNGRSGPCS